MKTVFVSALAITLSVAYAALQCDLATIESSLKSDKKTRTTMRTAQPGCLEDTGYDIFNITDLPALEQSKDAQMSSYCSQLINAVNGQANVASQCTINVNGTTITYGTLISAFINGKTGNESDSASGSAEISSERDFVSFEDDSNSFTPSTSGSATLAISFATYGAIIAIALY